MGIKEEEGDLWFNKGCASGRIATVIKADGKTWLTCTLAEEQLTTNSRTSWVGSWRVVKAGAGFVCSTPSSNRAQQAGVLGAQFDAMREKCVEEVTEFLSAAAA